MVQSCMLNELLQYSKIKLKEKEKKCIIFYIILKYEKFDQIIVHNMMDHSHKLT